MRTFTMWGLAAMVAAGASAGPLAAEPIPHAFAATTADQTAISQLLRDYTTAVNSRNKALFDSLLLDDDIPFSGVPTRPGTSSARTHDYAGFARGVFEGPPFHQAFRDVRIQQDGALATVTLVFVNTEKGGQSWGWKAMQLLKVDGRWKIASEFYTGHSSGG